MIGGGDWGGLGWGGEVGLGGFLRLGLGAPTLANPRTDRPVLG